MDFPSLMPQNYTGFVPAHPGATNLEGATVGAADSLEGKKAGFIAAIVARLAAIAAHLEASHWKRSLRAREAHLAQSQNVADLENRMREVDQHDFLRGRFLP